MVAAKGMKRLSNLFIKVLFTKPGTSLSYPQTGGNIVSLLTYKFSERDRAKILSETVRIIDLVEAQIKDMQKASDIPPEDTLLKVKLNTVEFVTPDYLKISVKLFNANGDVSDIEVPIVKSPVA